MNRFKVACYAGLGLLAIAISSIPTSPLSKAFFGGILLYFAIGLAHLVFKFVLRMLSGSVRQEIKLSGQFSAGLGFFGSVLLTTGILNTDTLLSQIGVAVILISLEYFLQERNTIQSHSTSH